MLWILFFSFSFIHTIHSSNWCTISIFFLSALYTHTHTTQQQLTGRFSKDSSSPVPRPMSCLVLFNIAADKERCEGGMETWPDWGEEHAAMVCGQLSFPVVPHFACRNGRWHKTGERQRRSDTKGREIREQRKETEPTSNYPNRSENLKPWLNFLSYLRLSLSLFKMVN